MTYFVRGFVRTGVSGKRTFVLFVERTVAAAAAKRMRLGVTLTGVRIRMAVQRHGWKERTHPNEDVPIEIGQKEGRQLAAL